MSQDIELTLGGGAESQQLVIEGKKVLVVEDTYFHQIIIEKRLAKLGCLCKIAVHGENALDVLREGGFVPDVIFMDLQMPILVHYPRFPVGSGI